MSADYIIATFAHRVYSYTWISCRYLYTFVSGTLGSRTRSLVATQQLDSNATAGARIWTKEGGLPLGHIQVHIHSSESERFFGKTDGVPLSYTHTHKHIREMVFPSCFPVCGWWAFMVRWFGFRFSCGELCTRVTPMCLVSRFECILVLVLCVGQRGPGLLLSVSSVRVRVEEEARDFEAKGLVKRWIIKPVMNLNTRTLDCNKNDLL